MFKVVQKIEAKWREANTDLLSLAPQCRSMDFEWWSGSLRTMCLIANFLVFCKIMRLSVQRIKKLRLTG